jgi:ABC-type transport system involved in multi-copper enzyme maturation permease subunit
MVTGLDLRVLQAVAKSLIGVSVALAVMVWITAPTPVMMVAVFLLTAAILAVDPFRSDERGHLDVLYATLPLARGQVVAGRYLTALVVQAMSTLAGLALGLVAAAIHREPLQPGMVATVMVAGFATNAVLIAVEFPIVFALGYSRARWVTFTPILLVCVAVVVGRSLGLNLAELVDLLQQVPSAVIVVTVALAGLGLLALSALLSVRLYRRRDL